MDHIKILEQIGTMYYKFGVVLLNEKRGDIIKSIEHECNRNVECINQKIVTRWLKGGNGYQEPTWTGLLNTLCTIEQMTLAEDIIKHLKWHDIDTGIHECKDSQHFTRHLYGNQ